MTAEYSASAIDLARSPDFTLGRATIRPSLRRVQSGDRADTLEPRVMQALVALAERADEVVARGELIERCWSGRIVGDDAVTQCLAKLRRVGVAHGAFTLEAVPRVGYRLSVSEAPPVAASLRKRRAGPDLVAAVTAAAARAAVWLARPAPLAGLTASAPVEVEPFKPVPGDPAARRFAETAKADVEGRLTDCFIALAPPGDAGRRLRVDGVVLLEDGLLKVRPRLVESGSRTVVWAGDFQVPVEHASDLRNQVAWRVTGAVQMAQQALAFPSRDLTPAALALMVGGRDNARQSNWKGQTAVEQLLRVAPRFARGHAEAAMALTAASRFTDGERADVLLRRARAEAATAVKLERRDPINWAAQETTVDGRDWFGRARLLHKADSLGPPGAPSPWAAGFLLDIGRLREGLLMARQMIPQMKGYPMVGGATVSAFYLAGQRRQAEELADEIARIRPADAALLHARMLMLLTYGDPDEAQAQLIGPGAQATYLRDPTVLAACGAAVGARKSGSQADRAKAVCALMSAANARLMPRGDAIRLLVALGATHEALAVALAYAADPWTTRTANLFEPRFLFAADLAPLRREPRFADVVERLGLADYWRRTGVWPDFCEDEPQAVCSALRRLEASEQAERKAKP